MLRSTFVVALIAAALAAAGCAAETGSTTGSDLGTFPSVGKGDEGLSKSVSFVIAEGAVEGVPSESKKVTFEACGRVAIEVEQESAETLQIAAESTSFRRRSTKATAPFLTVPGAADDGQCARFTLKVLNWGAGRASGKLLIRTSPAPEPGIRVVFNQPDCDDGCTDKTGGIRRGLVDVIQSAQKTIDMAIYGLDDPQIVEALCNAIEGGVTLRVVADDGSEMPASTRSYYESLFGEDGLAGCGAQVEAVRSSGIMHDKVLVIDRGTPGSLLVSGSTNFTIADIDKSHNHVTFLRGFPGLEDAYAAELEQLLRHCASDRMDTRMCTECTPACVEDVSEEGPYVGADGTEVSVYFSPVDDAFPVLRGKSITRRKSAPDPACNGPDADCICRTSGAGWSCDYCAQEGTGYGLVGEAQDRLYVNAYNLTDQCLALGLVKAKARGVEVLTVWDMVLAASDYSRDDYLCANGIPTWISDWAGGHALVRNHSKTVVIDDMVFDGSMNLSVSGSDQNNENTLLIRSAEIAGAFARYIEEEAALLGRLGVMLPEAETCRCTDLVDNDGDGTADGMDADCDGGAGG